MRIPSRNPLKYDLLKYITLVLVFLRIEDQNYFATIFILLNKGLILMSLNLTYIATYWLCERVISYDSSQMYETKIN